MHDRDHDPITTRALQLDQDAVLRMSELPPPRESGPERLALDHARVPNRSAADSRIAVGPRTQAIGLVRVELPLNPPALTPALARALLRILLSAVSDAAPRSCLQRSA